MPQRRASQDSPFQQYQKVKQGIGNGFGKRPKTAGTSPRHVLEGDKLMSLWTSPGFTLMEPCPPNPLAMAIDGRDKNVGKSIAQVFGIPIKKGCHIV